MKTPTEQFAKLAETRLTTLDAVECEFLADFLQQQPDATQHATLIEKLRQMGEKAAQHH